MANIRAPSLARVSIPTNTHKMTPDTVPFNARRISTILPEDEAVMALAATMRSSETTLNIRNERGGKNNVARNDPANMPNPSTIPA